MNSNHRVTILALSLSVLTLAAISTILSLNQSGVLGVTTSPMPPRPTVTIPQTDRGVPCDTFKTVFSMATTTNPIYTQLAYLLKNFCPTTTVTPITTPSVSVCKTGVSNISFGSTCSFTSSTTVVAPGYNFAKITCYDGTTTSIGNSLQKVCYQSLTIQTLAKKFCDGKTSCNKPTTTPRPSVYPTKTISISPIQAKCGWCGTACTLVKPSMMCPMVATPAGQQCISAGNQCTIVYSDPLPIQ
ncbi:hypothetical protein KBC75_04765 [Candidatus Shapirobacteria bacterium]|nr:hypothetical protein [Candidatus Shapirobacteria bacterium]